MPDPLDLLLPLLINHPGPFEVRREGDDISVSGGFDLPAPADDLYSRPGDETPDVGPIARLVAAPGSGPGQIRTK